MRIFLLAFFIISMSCFSDESESIRIFLDAEFLYWKPSQTGMSYCLLTDTVTQSVLGTSNQDRQQNMTWGPGFRVGTGIRIPSVRGDLSAYWTRFHHTMNGSTNTSDFILGTQLFLGDFIPIGGGGVAQISGGIPAGSATSQWKLQVDLIECNFGYLACFEKRFSLHPYLGIEGGWINQKQTIDYDQFFDPNSQVFFDSSITLTNNFQGIGPKLGIDGDFIFGRGFGLVGDLAAIFLYGSSHNPTDFHIEGSIPTFPFPDFSIQYQQLRLIPAIQAQIGLNYGKECLKYYVLYLSVAYEVQYFWNTWRNQSSAIQSVAVPDAGYGNLMLQGFTGRVQFAF